MDVFCHRLRATLSVRLMVKHGPVISMHRCLIYNMFGILSIILALGESMSDIRNLEM